MSVWSCDLTRSAPPDPPTRLVARRQVLVLVARVPLLPVQQQEVDHLLLVVPADRGELRLSRSAIIDSPAPAPPTHSSDSRSLVSFSLSLKQPREFMLSSTSGSISSDARVRTATFLGTGCSGSGSFFPPLQRHSGS